MKILRQMVLVGCALAVAIGLLGSANASAGTVTVAGTGGDSTYDTGWG